MPRPVNALLRRCYQRANPCTDLTIEVGARDATGPGRVVRRWDDALADPATIVSVTPLNALTAGRSGALRLAATGLQVASFTGAQGTYALNPEDPSRRLKGLAWQLDPALAGVVLRTVTVRVWRNLVAGGWNPNLTSDFELQIYRADGVPGQLRAPDGTLTPTVRWSFAELLAPGCVVHGADVPWGQNGMPSTDALLTFDLANWGLVLDNRPGIVSSTTQSPQRSTYYLVVRALKAPSNDVFGWRVDTASARTVAGVGTFNRVFWARANADAEWSDANTYADVPYCQIAVESVAPAGGQAQAVVAIDCGGVPGAASTGRVVFERSLPAGTTCTAEISTAGSGGPWTAVTDGTLVAVRQQLYHLRLTLTPDAAQRRTPGVLAAGLEWRTPVDVSAEALPELPRAQIGLPYCQAAIAEGALTVVRTGIRDYRDPATTLAATQPITQLEADIFLSSRHPAVTRDAWLRLERLMVTTPTPGATSERLTLLSYLQRLKRKIPPKKETLVSTHTVQAAPAPTFTAMAVSPALLDTTVGGTEYLGKNYYVKVVASSVAGLFPGQVFPIASSSGQTQLLFGNNVLPAAFAAGDTIEVHSGILSAQSVSYPDWDPADVWWDLLTNQLGIPPERLGRAGGGSGSGGGGTARAGLPPKLTDRAPDAATQNKLRVTMKLDEQEDAADLVAQVSFLLGGATVEEAGQLLWVPIYAQRTWNGAPPPALCRGGVAAVFDERDYAAGLQTPRNIEQRITILNCAYGVDVTKNKNGKASTANASDVDALAWLQRQDLELAGFGEIPDEIARWCYNSTDRGLYLASLLCEQVVRACSTGLRIWTVPLAELHPDLVLGDRVTIITDQPTDYDPATDTPLTGRLAWSGIVVGKDALGQQLQVFIPGLYGNVGNNLQLTGAGQAGDTSAVPPVTAQPPGAAIAPVGQTLASVTVSYTGTLGVGGAGPLSLRRRIDTDGAQGAWGAPAGALANEAIARDWIRHKVLILEVTDTGTGLVTTAQYPIAARLDSLDSGTGQLKPDVPMVGGDYPVRTGDGGGRFDFADGARALNKHLGNIADDPTSDRRAATATEKTGGGRAAVAIDGGNVLVAGSLDFSRNYTGKHGENLPRSSTSTAPVANVVANLTDQSQLVAGTAIQRATGDAQTVRLARGGREGTCRHNQSGGVVFSPQFGGVPVILLRGGVSNEPGNKWGTALDVDSGTASGAKLAGVREYEELIALNPGPGSFTPRLRLRQKGALVNQNYNFSGSGITVVGGTDLSAALAAGPAANDTYTINVSVTVSARASTLDPNPYVEIDVTYIIEVAETGGSFHEVARRPAIQADSDGVTNSTTYQDTFTISVSGMTTSGRFRIKVVDATKVGSGTTSYNIRGYVNTTDGDYGVKYQTSTGDKYASKTPDTDDVCYYAALEVA